MFYFALFCVEPNLMRLAVTMFILGVGTSPSGKTRVNKSNTANTGIRTNLTPAAVSIGRRSTISYDQAKTSSSSTERTNDVPRYANTPSSPPLILLYTHLLLYIDSIGIFLKRVYFTIYLCEIPNNDYIWICGEGLLTILTKRFTVQSGARQNDTFNRCIADACWLLPENIFH